MENGILIGMGISLAVGIFFAAIGVLGILIFPGYYARAQAATCITTLGTLGAIVSSLIYAVYTGLGGTAYVKLVMVAVMVMVSSAVSSHALTKGTYKRGHRPHGDGFLKDDYKEDGFDEN